MHQGAEIFLRGESSLLTLNMDKKKVGLSVAAWAWHLGIKLVATRAPCHMFDPWVRWERDQIKI